MGGVTTAELAAHIAAILDGDWDDGLNAYVEAAAETRASGVSGLRVSLKSDGGDEIGLFRIIVKSIA